MTTDTSTAQRAQSTASTAADEGKHVAGTAKEQATTVASEAADQARNVVSDAVSQVSDTVREQSATQRDRLVGAISTFGDDLSSMAEQGTPGLATDVARQVAERARSLTTQLEREPQEILEDVRRFARQRPGTFLLGALAAGVLAGRLLRGAGDGIAGAAATQPASGTSNGTATDGYGTSSFASASTTDAGFGLGEPTTNPTLGVTTHGQPTQEANYSSTEPLGGVASGNEAGYSGGGLSGDGRS
jgi:hypothetical protein